jgi:hypothetical protein
MAKISIDVEEIKKGIKTRALQAAADLSDLAKRAQKDLTQEKILKKVDEVVTIVKSQEFMKNPKVAELAGKILALSEQIEKTVSENVGPKLDELRARVKTAADKAMASKYGRAASAKTSASNDDDEEVIDFEDSNFGTKVSTKTAAKKTASKKSSKKS